MAYEDPENDPLAFIQKESPLEDVQRSNILFNRVRLGDFCSLYFSMTSVGLSIIAYEIDYENTYYNFPDEHPNVILVNITMWLAFVFNLFLFISIVLRHTVYFKWIHSKKLITRYDTMRSTGHWKIILTEVAVCLIMPLPFINKITYSETWVSNGSEPTVV
jgi:magnesium-transporting ATPase (P-type)